MSVRSRLGLSAASLAFALASGGAARASATVSIGDPVAMTVYLPLKNQAAADAASIALQTPGGPSYRKFLSVAQFVDRYAFSDADIATVETALKALGFGVAYVFPNHLGIQVTGSASLVEKALGTTLRTVTVHGRTGIMPATPITIPASLQGLILGVGGLDTVHHARPHHLRSAVATATPATGARQLLPGNLPGNYLPATFEADYDVNPLYAQGLTGRGRTIGIVTLNNFNPSDAYSFWQQIGLTVNQSRVTLVNVDGGLTASTNNADGEGETDIDVQESGSIAPDANERVYIAPNVTTANFIDGFEAAASENVADTVSSSWGEPELEFFPNLAGTNTGANLYQLQAFHLVFLEMALQGQTVFIAAGDSGSFDTVEDPCPFYGTPTAAAPTCNAPYALDQPSDDPLVTASGGTTLAFTTTFMGVNLSIAHEQAWGWKYLATEAAAQGLSSVFSIPDVFSTGGGGGVSSYWTVPWYQAGTPGLQLTEPNQIFTENSGQGPVLQNVLLPYFPGRNSPDISTDADPFSGYQFLEEGVVQNGYGGTSFVAPQLNGVDALLSQALGGRVGQINPALYLLGSQASRDIALGNNWGYDAVRGYDQATGVGALDAAKLLAGLQRLGAR